MVLMEEVNLIIFIASPRLESLDEMERRNIYLCDIPLFDVTRELVLLNQQRIAEIEVSKKLDETQAAMKKTSRAIAIEKERADQLLYQMLPEKVATQLKEGKKVAAGKPIIDISGALDRADSKSRMSPVTIYGNVLPILR